MVDFPARDWLVASEVGNLLQTAVSDAGKIREVLAKARELKGLSPAEVAVLCQISTPDLAQSSTYTLTCGSQTVEIPLTGIITSNGQSGMGGPGQGGQSQPQGGQKPQ